MKRDMDLVREILMETEALPSDNYGGSVLVVEGVDGATLDAHIRLMDEAGLLNADYMSGTPGSTAYVKSLTWEGHDFLDAIRDDSIWMKVKSRVADTVGTASFEILMALALAMAKEKLGLH